MTSPESSLIATTLFRLGSHTAAGLVAALWAVKETELGRGYDRLIAALTAFLAALALAADPFARSLWSGQTQGIEPATLCPPLLALTGIIALPAALGLPIRRDLWIGSAAAAGLASVALDTLARHGPVPLPSIGFWLHPISALSASLLLGAVAVAALSWWWICFDPEAADWPLLLSGISPFILGRVLLGIALPAGAMLLARGTVRIRSTQSATGILYFVSVFLVAGELMAGYVLQRTGIPI